MSEDLKNIKPFDHKPEKRGSDGKILKAEYHSCHIVGGEKFFSYHPNHDKFYTEGGHQIPLEDVPSVVKKHLMKKDKVVGKLSKKPGDSSDLDGSLV